MKTELEFTQQALPYFQGLLEEFRGNIEIVDITREPMWPATRADAVFTVEQYGQTWQLLVNCKTGTYPTQVAKAIMQLRDAPNREPNTYPVLVLPWLSETVMKLCSQAGVGCVGLEGNYRLNFGGLYALSRGASKPKTALKTLQSLFQGKSARVLRLMLRQPERHWRMQALAEEAQVSLGQIHKVSQALLTKGWLEKRSDGIRIAQADELISAWRDQPQQRSQRSFYTIKHGAALQKALQPNDGTHWLHAGFSAADWLAPWVRQNTFYAVADERGIEQLTEALQLEETSKGFNVIIVSDDGNVLNDRFEAAEGIWTTSPLETYLTLYQSHDRGREAADQLWQKYQGHWQ